MIRPMNILLVDDEALARSRLRSLLGQNDSHPGLVVVEAAGAEEAKALLEEQAFDLVLLDIQMPGIDGMELARQIRLNPPSPAVVFVTAHEKHALHAFELEAIDYLTKPVRLERLQQALHKVQRLMASVQSSSDESQADYLLIHDRGRTERVPLADVLYLKAELKYVTVRTQLQSLILNASLNDLEASYPQRFLRIHRNTLVARAAIKAIEHTHVSQDGEGWVLRLEGLEEPLPVSRRQLSAVRAALSGDL